MRVVTAGSDAITTADAKAWARVTASDDDSLFSALIAAAQDEWVTRTQAALVLTTYEDEAVDWWEGRLVLPRQPVSSVTSVSYYDADNTLQVLSTSLWALVGQGRAQGIELRSGLPALVSDSTREERILVRWVAGHANAAAVPASIVVWLKARVLQLYTHRGDDRAGFGPDGALDAILRMHVLGAVQ